MRLPGAAGDPATLVPEARPARRVSSAACERPAVHARSPSRRRATRATCSSCCRCAAASTACRPSCRHRAPVRHYAAWRPGIGVPAGALLPLDATFGLHPALAPLKPLWDAGLAGVVHAVGHGATRPARTSARWRRWSGRLPASLRTGWLDRVLGAGRSGIAVPGDPDGLDAAPPRRCSGPAPELAMWIDRRLRALAAPGTDRAARWDTALRGLHDGRARRGRGAGDHGARRADDVGAALGDADYAPGERRRVPGHRTSATRCATSPG